MKKVMVIIAALSSTLSCSALAKVTYEDALASSRPYEEANAAVHIPPDTKGLTPREFEQSMTDSWAWRYLGKHRPDVGGFIRLDGEATGSPCAPKDAYGMEVRKQCSGTNQNSTTCHDYSYYYHCE